MASERQIHVGAVPIGGGAPVAVQTMTKTETADLQATMDQIRRVAEAGADIVRVAVPRDQDVEALRTIVPRVADPGHRRHPLQPHARAQGARRRRALRAPQSRQHRRPGQGRGGDSPGDRAGHAAASRRQLGLAAGPPAPARVRQPGRGARHGRGRDRRADGAARLPELQGVDEVDVGARTRSPPTGCCPSGSRTRCISA